MASQRKKSYYSSPNYRFLSSDQQLQAALSHDSAAFELDESDFYSNAASPRSDSPEFRTSRGSKKPFSKRGGVVIGGGGGGGESVVRGAPASLPVNIPDWSKILREEYRDNRRRSESDDDDYVGGEDWLEGGVRVPPHEFLANQMARTRVISFSVHEGIGRTLKGRDLRRVRNAIFEKTGFQD